MSLFNQSNLTCLKCQHVYAMDVVASINADRRPDLRDEILDNKFQDTTCPACGNSTRMEPMFSYMDVGRGQWLACMPARDLATYRTGEADAKSLFAKIFGADAPEESQEVGDSLQPRITFGWPAVREKLLIRELGFDDVVVEQMKLDLIRRLPEVSLAPGVELRLVAKDADTLRFHWVDSTSEDVTAELSVDRELYDAIDDDKEGWAEIRTLLTDGYFVDMQKTFIVDKSAGPAAAAA